MCGDVNLFMLDEDASETYAPPSAEATSGSAEASAVPQPKAAEIMVMMADPVFRRKGYALEAVVAMLEYGRRALGLRRFVAKITDTNEASIALFRKLGFREAKRLAVFSEVHFALDVPDDSVDVAGSIPQRAKELAWEMREYANPEE
jgi:RimJ/RimL family protein N-acetyltransferase